MGTHDFTADRELVELGRAFDVAWAYENLVWQGTEDVLTEEAERMQQEANAATAALAEQIEAIPATTLEGVQVKARVVSWCCTGAVSQHINQYGTMMERVLDKMLADLLSPAASSLSRC